MHALLLLLLHLLDLLVRGLTLYYRVCAFTTVRDNLLPCHQTHNFLHWACWFYSPPRLLRTAASALLLRPRTLPRSPPPARTAHLLFTDYSHHQPLYYFLSFPRTVLGSPMDQPCARTPALRLNLDCAPPPRAFCFPKILLPEQTGRTFPFTPRVPLSFLHRSSTVLHADGWDMGYHSHMLDGDSIPGPPPWTSPYHLPPDTPRAA